MLHERSQTQHAHITYSTYAYITYSTYENAVIAMGQEEGMSVLLNGQGFFGG